MRGITFAILGIVLFLTTGCGQSGPASTQSAEDFFNSFSSAFPDNQLITKEHRPPKGDGSDVPLKAIPLDAKVDEGTSRGVARGVDEIYGGWSPAYWLNQFAQMVFRHPLGATFTSVGRITLGSEYYYASQFSNPIYNYFPNQSYCLDWNVQLWTNSPHEIYHFGSTQGASVQPTGTQSVWTLTARTYGRYEEIETYIGLTNPTRTGQQKQFWILPRVVQCGANTVGSASWQNLTEDVNKTNEITYRVIRPSGDTGAAVTARFVNRTLSTTPTPGCNPQRILVAGIYESSGNHSIMGNATVTISTGGDVALVVSSYESTRWNVVTTNGTRVCRVLANGYDRQEVTGSVSNVELRSYEQGNYLGVGFPYSQANATALINAAYSRYGQLPVTFRGAYQSTSLSF